MTSTDDLRDRELEILRLVATGASNKEIAGRLNISTNTVKVHLRNIFAKIGVSSRTEAAMYAVNAGLVDATHLAVGEAPAEEFKATSPVEHELKAADSKSTRPGESRIILYLAMAGVLISAALGAALLWTSGVFAPPIPPAPTATLAPVQSNWSVLASLPKGRSGLALVAYEDRLYAIGGASGDGITGVVERYDPVTNRWRAAQVKPLPVMEISAAVISGKIYVPGGITGDGLITDRLEIYDPARDTWSDGAPLPQALSSYALVTFDGNLYLFGGWNGSRVLNTVYQYNPVEDRWTSLPDMPTARRHLGAAASGRKIFVVGGEDDNGPLPSNEIFLPDLIGGAQPVWEAGAPLPEPISGAGAAGIADIIYVVGGIDAGNREYPMLAFDPAQGWRAVQSLPDGLAAFHGLAGYGKFLYIAGGLSGDLPSSDFLRYQAVYTVSFPIIIR